MLPIVQHYDALAVAQYGILKRTLTAVTEEELDWHIHPKANTIGWLLGHQVWYETWVPDAIQNTGRYLEDARPITLPVASHEDFTERFEAAMAHRQAVYETLGETDLAREFSYFGKATYSVSRVIRTHAAHFTGHTWQMRMIRGVYSKAQGTDKTVFDPW